MMNPDGTGQQRCDCPLAYIEAMHNDVYSPDGRLFAFVKYSNNDYEIWTQDVATGWQAVLTGNLPGFPGSDYEPAWSPDSIHVAWVTTKDKKDEIYLLDRSTGMNRRLTPSEWESYKHPTFSPDGGQIAFWSNRVTGRKQIWVVNLDGSGMRNLSQNEYNDWDPVWIRDWKFSPGLGPTPTPTWGAP